MNCSTNTKDNFGRIVRNHILPALGGLAVSAVERRHVVALHDRLSGMPTQANRTLAVLSAMFKLAEAWDLALAGDDRTWRTGARWEFSPDAVVGLEVTRSEPANGGAEHAILFRALARW